ncbi:MAG TPA: hypothetical protein VGJ52_09580 [Vicinamibacterales bacterium]
MRPSDLVHLHLLLNHFPTVGMIVGFGVFLLALAKKSEDLKRGGLAVLFVIALLSLPTYMTGYSAQKSVKGMPGVSQGVIDLHQRSALMALMFMEATGVAAWYGLWYSRGRRPAGAGNTAVVLVLAAVTIGLMASAANVGGEIRHPEILSTANEVPATEGLLAPHWLASDFITRYQYSHPWAWKTLETIHFMGLCLLFGVVLVGNMRLLGWMRNAPLEGFHRLLPWGVWGFVANSVTGMMFFIGQAFQYIENAAFHWKILCILLAGADVLYLTWHDEVWEMGPGDTAPAMVKVLAASQIFLWIGVIYFGRMLPYLGNAF